jgi:hypothetical protein
VLGVSIVIELLRIPRDATSPNRNSVYVIIVRATSFPDGDLLSVHEFDSQPQRGLASGIIT